MDLLSLILTCSLYTEDDSLVRAIAEATPGGNPYFVVDASQDLTQVDPPPPANTAADALSRAADMVAKGGRPLLGLLELPPAWLAAFGQDLGDAFAPCINIAIGSAMLSAFHAECAQPNHGPVRAPRLRSAARDRFGVDARRTCVLRKYEDAIGSADFAMTITFELRYQRPPSSHLAESPIFAAERAPAWGPDQVLVPIRGPGSPSAQAPPASSIPPASLLTP